MLIQLHLPNAGWGRMPPGQITPAAPSPGHELRPRRLSLGFRELAVLH